MAGNQFVCNFLTFSRTLWSWRVIRNSKVPSSWSVSHSAAATINECVQMNDSRSWEQEFLSGEIFWGIISQDPSVPMANWFTWCDLAVFFLFNLEYYIMWILRKRSVSFLKYSISTGQAFGHCSGSIIGRDSSVPNPHVHICLVPYFLYYMREIFYRFLSSNFNWLFLKLNLFICDWQLVLPIHCVWERLKFESKKWSIHWPWPSKFDKVDVARMMDAFFSAPTSCRIFWNTQLMQDDWRIQITVVAICLKTSGIHTNILFIIKVKNFVLIQWSYWSPQSCWLLSLDWLVYYGHVVRYYFIYKYVSNFFDWVMRSTLNHTL